MSANTSALSSLALLLLAACASPTEEAPPVASQPAQDEPRELSVSERARAALDAGDFETARALTTELVVEARLAEAAEALAAEELDDAWRALDEADRLSPRDSRVRALREAIAAEVLPRALSVAREEVRSGDPRDAMLALDEAVRVAPEDPEVQLLRGVSSLRMGQEDGNPLMFADAREAFLAAARTGRADIAWLGAARAGWLSYYATNNAGELADALAHAKAGIERMGEAPTFVEYLDFDPDRTYAEVAFAAYVASKSGALPSERSAALFEDTRAALESVLGLAPSDPWAWGQLSNLYEWEGRLEEARGVLERGLAISPDDPTLHDSLVRVTSALGGWEETLSVYEAFMADHDALAVGPWQAGRATYELALARMLESRSDQSAGFQDAEALFRTARELDESYTQASLGYEVVCRDGMGWSLYFGGELDLAADAFFSMEELFEGGLRWGVEGKLLTGVASLEFLLAQHNAAWEAGWGESSPPAWAPERGDYDGRFAHLVKAAELASRLFEYDPESSDYANNAGYFHRDTATQLEAQGAELLLDKDAGEEAATPLLRGAVEHMERSYAAYTRAAELSPDDPRVQNDTGLILVYYLQRELDTAQAYLERALALGQPLLDAGIEDEAHRAFISEAVGDAHQNLGMLELTLRGNAAAARAHFEASLSGYERSDDAALKTRHRLIPLCDLLEAGEVSAELLRDAYAWKDLSPELVLRRLAAFNEVMALTSGR